MEKQKKLEAKGYNLLSAWFIAIIFFIIGFGNTHNLSSQVTKTEEPEEVEEQMFFIVEKMPEFPGGDLGLRNYIASNVQYPDTAREAGIEGKIYVRFCVTKNGSVSQVAIARGADPILNKEAIRVVKTLPKWKPGEHRGRKVNVWYTIPIDFSLSENEEDCKKN